MCATAGDRPKVIYYTACTLDGFIADDDHSLQWLFDVPEGDDDGWWERFIGRIGALAMGSSTYRWVLENEDLIGHPDKWREWYGDRPCWVFTHQDLPAIPGVDIRFVADDVRPVFEQIAGAGAGDLWVMGGGDLVGQFDDVGLLDEVHLSMMPVTLGAGAPLLPRRITSDRLTLVSAEQVGPHVRLSLAVSAASTGILTGHAD